MRSAPRPAIERDEREEVAGRKGFEPLSAWVTTRCIAVMLPPNEWCLAAESNRDLSGFSRAPCR